MISIRNLKKHFEGPDIFHDVNLDINDGEAVVIIGASGCGKSTLLRCINRLNVPDEGEVLIDGQNIHAADADVDAIRRNMGMVYQHFNLFSHLNVLENIIEAPMKVLKMSQEDAIKEAIEYLKLVGLESKKYHMPSALSGGQKQRVAIARTLAMHPKYILFDEPTSALDPTMVGEVESVIRNLVESGITSIIVTHEMRFAKSIASKVVFLAEQGIYETGTAEEVFDNPQKPLTRDFLFSSRSKSFDVTLESDIEGMISAYKAFLNRYDHDSKQMELFRVAFDEAVLPALISGRTKKCKVTLVCSDTSQAHSIYLDTQLVDNYEEIEEPWDDISLAICKAKFKNIGYDTKEKDGKTFVELKLEM